MGLILLEALLALVLLLVIVWWTMFSGRKGGELKPTEPEAPAPVPPAARDAAASPTQPPDSGSA